MANLDTLWYVELIADNTHYNCMVRASSRLRATILAMGNAIKDGCKYVNDVTKVERIG